MSAPTNTTTQMYNSFNAPAPTVSLQQWAEAESSNLDAQETIRHLKEVVIPNLQERQKLQNEYWSNRWNESQAEIECLKMNTLYETDNIDMTPESYNERLNQSEHMVCNLQKRILLLENGVTQARVARREANFHKKENKRLKAQLAESESWREFLGASCYDHGARYEEEHAKRDIIQEKMREIEEKYERTRHDLFQSENRADSTNISTEQQCREFQQVTHQMQNKCNHAENSVIDMKKNLDNTNNVMEGLKEQLNAAKEVNDQWYSVYNELLEKHNTMFHRNNENSRAQNETNWDNNYIHDIPSVHESINDLRNNIEPMPAQSHIRWDSENQPYTENII